ncbi:MAG: hypothetical protein J6X39_07250 [Bacteroidales bacterium]|nr:hypothetical protein [Bacteroidales bacterium]
MKKLLLIKATIALCSCFFIAGSCRDASRAFDPGPTRKYCMVWEGDWLGSMDSLETCIAEPYSCLFIYTRPSGVGIRPKNYKLEAAFTSYYDDKWSFTDAEKFAIGKIKERTEPLLQAYLSSPEEFKRSNGGLLLTNIYIRESPRVFADKRLFGEKSGQDLSRYFLFDGGSVGFKCVGLDYAISDVRQLRSMSFNDYFSEGTIMPMMFFFRSTTIPEELSEDDDVTLTFIFPVTIEHYWPWLLELYENPDAKESFTETNMVLSINLKDLPTHSFKASS